MDDLRWLDRAALIARLQDETKAQSACTVFYHEAVAQCLDLNPTDQKCLDLILKHEFVERGEPMTPSQLARLTNLTSGAVTGVLDRLEHAGFVKREHDPEDRRRIIVRPTPERIKEEVGPILEWFGEMFRTRCGDYSEDELRLIIGFARRCQSMLQEATTRLRAQELAPKATV